MNTTNTSRRSEALTNRIWQKHAIGLPLQQRNTIPKWMLGSSIAFFFIALFACWIAFGYVPGIDLVMQAAISVLLFFAMGHAMATNWSHVGEKQFMRNVFVAGFVVRLLYVLYMFFIFNPEHYGTNFGSTADTGWYMDFGHGLADWILGNSYYSLPQVIDLYMSAIDDVGYPMWLGVIYVLTAGLSDVFMPMLAKCIMGAYCALCIYRVAKRHFGVGTARIAAIFVCLNPNMIYWCASMMKEAEMVFICCMAVDKLDQALSSGAKLTFRSLLPGLLFGLALFFFRTALGLALFLAAMAHLVFASKRVISTGKKVIAGVLVAVTLFIGVGDRLFEQSRDYIDNVQSGGQQANMEWRSERAGGNNFAKYAGAAVFAPLIFTIPFPTFNAVDEFQLVQIQLSGGSYIKNILSFFVVVFLVYLLLTSEWRKHVFILAYTCAYLGVLVFSGHAQSGRFHMPVWPMLMLFAAAGLQSVRYSKRMRKWFYIVLIAEVIICLVWNWFKLAGRGLV